MISNSQKKIKVLFRHRSMEMGGVEKVMLSLLNNLNKDKFEMTVLLNLNQGELRNEFPSHVRKVFLTKGKEDFSKNLVLQKIQLFQRKRKLDRLQKKPQIIDKYYLSDHYDVEIAMTYNDFESVLHSSNKNSKKIGWFHSEINTPGFEPLVPAILKNFPKFDQIVYCSEKIKYLMHAHHPNLKYPPEKVIINAIDIDEIKQKSAEEIGDDFPNKPVFLSIGRLHFRKGYHQLIEAHSKLIAEGFSHTVVIIGEGEQRKTLEDLIAERKVEKTFLLLGNRMNPYPYIKNADFFVLPSSSEAWPLVIAEALILKKPIIATKTGDIPLMIEHKKTGCLVNYDVNELYEAMKIFLTDQNLVADLKKNLINIEEQFDNQKIFNAVENVILELVKPEN